jgi:triosephosphate isomerase
MMNTLTASAAKDMLLFVADRMIASKDLLTEADNVIGDGDHGTGMAFGMQKVKDKLATLNDPTDVYAVFDAAGKAMLMSMGGASGVIFGSLFMGGAKGKAPAGEIGAEAFAQLMLDSLDAIKARGKASVGDKTMVDALEPAAFAMREHASEGFLPMLEAAEQAAEAGKEATKDFIAKYGRAKTLGERALGHPDAGAISVTILIGAMREFAQQRGEEMARLSKLYLGTNLKMYKNIAQTAQFLSALQALTADIPRDALELFVVPSFTSLETAARVVNQDMVALGAQNMGWCSEGALTGEVSPLMLKEIGIRIAEIGHSERRHVFGETDDMENMRVRCALDYGLTPLLCVGETAEEKRYGISDERLSIQLKRGLYGVTPEQAKSLMVAYEPVWAIGESGTPAEPDYVALRHTVMRCVLITLFGQTAGTDLPILYGGSVNNDNAVGLIKADNVDGLFIGRSAWDAANFNKIIRMALAAKGKANQ